MIELLVTNKQLQVVADPLVAWTDLRVTRNLNAAASGALSLVAWPEVMAQLLPGRRLVVIRDGAIWCAGPMEVPAEYSYGLGGDGGVDAPDPGTVSVNFSDDFALIAGRRVYPDPAKVISDGTQPASYVRTGVNAETLLRDLVNLNAGPGALTARRIPQLLLGAAAGVGTNVNLTARLEPLGDVLRSVALDGGGLVFETVQVGTTIEFRVRAARDLTASCRFSFGMNNLRSVRFKRSSPTVTTAIVGGSGQGDARTFLEVTNSSAESEWWRVESLVDETSAADNSAGVLTRAGTEALAGGAQPVELATVTVDVPDGPAGPGQIAGRDFRIGDKVTVELPTGVEVAELVRSDTLTATPSGGEYVTCVVGSPDATTDPQWVQAVRELQRRLGRLEAR